MKIYVHCSNGVDEEYQRVNPDTVIRRCLNGWQSKLGLSKYELSELVHILGNWKSNLKIDDHDVEFHHFDKDTKHNFADNIYLITSSAHGTIHNYNIILRLIRRYSKEDMPIRVLGHKSDIMIQNIFRQAFLDMDNKGCFRNILQLFEYYSKPVEKPVADWAHEILSNIDPSEYVIRKSDIHHLLLDSDIDYSELPDVTDIDNEVGQAVIAYLKKLAEEGYDSKMHIKSIAALKSYIENNETSREELRRDFENGYWHHSK